MSILRFFRPSNNRRLVDWLHWGGQIIISGPKSLDLLRGKTFLGPYLPALPGEPIPDHGRQSQGFEQSLD